VKGKGTMEKNYMGYVYASAERHKDTFKRYEAGESIESIAKSYGVVPQTIQHHLKNMGIKTNSETKRRLVVLAKQNGIDVDRWLSILPENIAWQQIYWERHQCMFRAVNLGLPIKTIEHIFNISRARLYQLRLEREKGYRKRHQSPAERWFSSRRYLTDFVS
jgi:DNA-binding CsgD family transcriptional regulator